ncbi:MAG: tRNA (adenosine(37)-N6)-threonylcarbamoyltransferase complex ATPase subunit type 1 TsaE [Burkholderiaceae bacterium]|nr:tRNA (adenosine(37)-N6)-threonylcarbamoyltransferase complex ATPase subunit type 1 TsaE [Burkholderiaceae bacterium]
MDRSDPLALHLPDARATEALARRLAPRLEPGFVLYLSGDLGAGKTTFVRALLRALGFGGRVKSPSFSLLESYDLSKFRLYHFDFYRFDSGQDWLDAGFEEFIGAPNVAIVEWPERAAGTLPASDLHLFLRFAGDTAGEERIVEAVAGTERGRACLKALAPTDERC